MNVLMNEYIDGLCFLMNRRVDCSWMNEWMNEIIMIVFMNEWMEYHLKDEWFIVFVNEQMNGWMNECVKIEWWEIQYTSAFCELYHFYNIAF